MFCKLILIYSIPIVFGAISNRDIVSAIGKFLFVENKPTQVSSYLCWSSDDIIYLSKELNRIDVFLTTNNNKTFSHQSLPTFWPAEHQLYLIDLKCNKSLDILNIAQQDGLLKFPYRWIMIAENNQTIRECLQDFDIFLNTRIFLFELDKSGAININSIYRMNNETKCFIENEIAHWNGSNYMFYNRLIDNRNRSDLMGMHMNISMVNLYEDTLNHLEDLRNRHADALTKHNYLLVVHIAEMLNVTKHFRFHRNWGYMNPNTSIYDGEIGDIQLHISEIAGTPAFFIAERLKLIDYIRGTTPTNAKFIFRAPPLSVIANVLTLPFDIWVWYASFGILLIIFIVLYVIVKWEWSDKLFKSTISETHSVLYPSVLDVIQMQIGAICQQGAEAEPKSLAGRIATFSIFLALMFIYVSYSANIVALLQSTTDSIRTLDDLNNFRIELGAEDTPYNKFYFQKQTGEAQQSIYRKKIAPPNKPDNFMTAEKGVQKIRDDFFAFHAECDTVYKIMSNTFLESEKCGLKEIEFWSMIDPWVPIRKNSTYKELIKIGYAKLYETGIQSRNFHRIYTKKPMCQNKGANFMSVSLRDCYFAPLTYGIGISITILILLGELCIHKYIIKIKL